MSPTSDRAQEEPRPRPGEWIELAERRLRDTGRRTSAPRAAVLELIGHQACVLTAQQIADELRARDRPVGVATVYRTLEALVGLDLVQRLEIGGGSPTRYEPAFPGGTNHHHHLVCRRCGRVLPVEDAEIERAVDSLAARLDHRVEDHDLILTGVCLECGRRSGAEAQPDTRNAGLSPTAGTSGSRTGP